MGHKKDPREKTNKRGRRTNTASQLLLCCVTSNLSWATQANTPAPHASERDFVLRCRLAYPERGGWDPAGTGLSACTANAVHTILAGVRRLGFDHPHLWGIQEGQERAHMDPLLALVRRKTRRNGWCRCASARCGRALLHLLYDGRVLGPARPLEIASRACIAPGRPVQAVLFPRADLLVVHVHAPHPPEGEREGSDRIHYLTLYRVLLEACLAAVQAWRYPRRIVYLGDFNDHHAVLPQWDGFRLPRGRSRLRIQRPAPPTCCADTAYSSGGDYVLDTARQRYCGLPPGYDERLLQSDHRPLVSVAGGHDTAVATVVGCRRV